MMLRARYVLISLLACGTSTPTSSAYPAHSSAMALTSNGSELFVVNPDADSVSAINTVSGVLEQEILLGNGHPTPDGNGAYVPAVMPRALALSSDGTTLYVSGERSCMLHIVDVATGTQSTVTVGSEPVGLVLSNDGKSVYVACSQDNTVVRVDVATRTVIATANVPNEPWALALSPDGTTLFTTHFLGAQVTAIDVSSMTIIQTSVIADVAPRGDVRLANGQPRGLYDAVVRPSTTDLWVVHELLGTSTAQPYLNFESTAFPAVTVMSNVSPSAHGAAAGVVQQIMSTNAQDVPGVNGAFADVVSGPHAIAFTHDGAYALVVDDNSEDVLVIDANAHVEIALVRPLPGHQPEGIVIAPDDSVAYVQERNTNDVIAVALDRSTGVLVPTIKGTPIVTIMSDPMPVQMRLGQHLFYSSNTDEYPLSKNHWIACATCHMEGRSDAVTWRFAQGPRDTPTNAGGTINTGFLFRTADRTQVQDYWRTVNTEQGGSFNPDDPEDVTLLNAIAMYVNYGIPFPVPPTTSPTLVAKGAAIFTGIGCVACHYGPRFTDSGSGNPFLDLTGSTAPVLLHNVGTCAMTSVFPDVAHDDIAGDLRDPCLYDTPSLNGLASTPPYMHDGTSPTIADAVHRMYPVVNDGAGVAPLDAADEAALVEYLRSL